MLRLPQKRLRSGSGTFLASAVWQGNALLDDFHKNLEINYMKKKNLFRSEMIRVYVTEDEKKQIVKNMETAGLQTLTNYTRMMALNGRVIKIDFSTLKEALSETGQYVSELNRIGNNLNQIAHKLNLTDIVETEDVQFLVSEFAKIQKNYERSQRILLQEIQKITRSE